MNVDFSLTYNPNEQYNEIGYHTTYVIYKDNIISNGFIPSSDKDDWLGEGVYFWDNEENATWWKNKSNILKKCIFICNLKCSFNEYLNLDNKKEMENFEYFLNNYLKDMKKNFCYKPSFKNNEERRKFFCDVYCSNKNISILSFTFEHDIINKYGFKVGTYKRRQICVRNPEYIHIIDIKE